MWKNINIKPKNINEFTLDAKTGLLLVIYLAMKADNYDSIEEIDLIQQVISKSPIFESNSFKEDRQLILDVQNFYNFHKNNEKILNQALEVLPKHLKKTAYFLSMEMIFVDGVVTKKETEFMELLASKTNVSQELSCASVEIFSAMYSEL